MPPRRALRTSALALSALTLVGAAACGSSSGNGTQPVPTNGPGTSAAPGTTQAPEAEGLTRSEAEGLLVDYFSAYYQEDEKTVLERSIAWANRLGVTDDYVFSVKPRPETRPTRTVTAKVDKVTVEDDGKIAKVDGEVVATLDGPAPSGLDKVAETVTFSDFELWLTDSGPKLADFTSTPDNEYGPLSGRLRDQIGFLEGNEETAGDLTVSLGVSFRSAGMGAQYVRFFFRFENAGAGTYEVQAGGLASSYRVGSASGTMPTDGARIPPIAAGPGKTVTGYLTYNQPDGMEDGEEVSRGTLKFSITDGAGTRYPVEFETPNFPAKFSPK